MASVKVPAQVSASMRSKAPLRLLIVDDDETNLKLLRAQLELEGHSVLEARHGVDALRVLERETVDGVISDILMPRMDGYHLCLEVRKSAVFGGVPFVLYTSTYNSAADRKLAQSVGADGYLEKPAPTGTILAAVREAAGRLRPPVLPEAAQEIEASVLQQYSQALIRKLEEKSSELERAHAGLAQTEARLSGLIESAPDAIVATDAVHNIVLFNAAAERMFGCPAVNASGRSLSQFIPLPLDDQLDPLAESHGDLGFSAPRQGSRMVWALRQDGTRFPIEASVSTLRTAHGPIHTIFVRDITERHRAEQALARSEAGLRQAQLVARLAHVITGPDGAFESWSASFPELLGVDAAGMARTAREWLKVIHPEDAALFRTRAIESMREGTRSEVEYRIQHNGDWMHVRQVTSPLPAEGDQAKPATRWFSTLQDISQQKRAELRIRTQNRVLSVLSSINALIVRATDSDELLQETCRIAVDAGQYSIVWVGLIDDGARFVRFVAGYGGPESFYESLRAALATAALDGDRFIAGPVKTLRPTVLNDLQMAPHQLQHALAAGSRSVAALPLIIDGRAVGVLVLHTNMPDFFNSEEVKLLRDLAGDISFALNHLRKATEVHYLSYYDALTGLPNRRLFAEHLSVAMREREATGGALAIVLFDIERFRRVNETLGRAAGDELIKQVAARLASANASASRIGVDRFAMKVRDKHSVGEVARVVEQILGSCFGSALLVAGEELRIGCRCGVAIYPVDGSDAETLLGNAEVALRRAKETSRHCVFYAPELNARAAEALSLESRLRRAIERQEFVLHYQPKVSLADGRICGVEALIRWQEPERGLVPPGQFIAVLEELGLIDVVGEWALRQALRDQSRWRAADLSPPRVAVNVSPLQLRMPDFGDLIADIVHACPDGELELEITESMIMEDVDRNVATLRRIRAAGVTISIDDFGTGFSSLSYIAKLPVTSLKIDRAFVVQMTEGPEGMAIVSSIVALAHALKLVVIAEGVETLEQAQLLRLISCNEAQGFLYSKAVPAADLEGLLRGGALPPPGLGNATH